MNSTLASNLIGLVAAEPSTTIDEMLAYAGGALAALELLQHRLAASPRGIDLHVDEAIKHGIAEAERLADCVVGSVAERN